MAKVYTTEEVLFMGDAVFHRIQQLDEEHLKHVANILKLKETGTKLDLLKVILGYLSAQEQHPHRKGWIFFKY